MRKHNRKNSARHSKAKLADLIVLFALISLLLCFLHFLPTSFTHIFSCASDCFFFFSPTRRNLYSNSGLSLCMFYYILVFRYRTRSAELFRTRKMCFPWLWWCRKLLTHTEPRRLAFMSRTLPKRRSHTTDLVHLVKCASERKSTGKS